MNSLSLYALTSEMLELLEMEECPADAIEAVFGNIQAKDNKIAFFIKDLDASAEAHKAEAKRIAEKGKAIEAKAKRMKDYIKEQMERLDLTDLETGTFKFKIQNNPPALDITNEEEIPDAYKLIIPQQVEPDKERIKAALKAGEEVPGCRLTVGRSLRIK